MSIKTLGNSPAIDFKRLERLQNLPYLLAFALQNNRPELRAAKRGV
jgi:hypothetical protein